jgi:hypothetical protein
MSGNIFNNSESNNNNAYDFNLDELSSGIKACHILKGSNTSMDTNVSVEMLPLSNTSPSIITPKSNTASQQQQPTTSNPTPSSGSSSSSAAFDRWTLLDPSTIHYGPFSSDCSLPDARNLDGSQETFYITTAINYTNGPAHMGVSKSRLVLMTFFWFQKCEGKFSCSHSLFVCSVVFLLYLLHNLACLRSHHIGLHS